MPTTASSLPWSYRPLGVRVVLPLLATLLVVVIAVGWVTLPSSVRGAFTVWQIITLLLLLGAMLAGMYGLARCRVRATDAGVEVVNVFRRRWLAWPQILRVSQRPGDPWAVLDTDDGTAVAVMAIQGSDGARARAAVQRLATLVEQQTPTTRND
ncbi:MAG TPA: PH domain-containing protein [Nocardioidaceae bacterium]|nr:PH domain-containing protein [Nocardioidaceae bacterium]